MFTDRDGLKYEIKTFCMKNCTEMKMYFILVSI